MPRAEMKPRERVMAALNLQEPDRVPLDLAQAGGDGITIAAYQNLVKHLGLPPREIKVESRLAQSAHADEDVLRRFRIDFRRIDLGAPDGSGDVWLDNDSYKDEWGVVRTRPAGGFYYDLTGSPFANDDTISAIRQYPWPDPLDPGRFRGLRERARALHEGTDFATVLQVNCAFFLRCAELRGWENWYVDLLANPKFACALMDRYLDVRLAIAGRALEECAEYADIVFVSSDDLGMIDRPILRPAVFRELVLPRIQRTFQFFANRTSAKRFFHSDGAVYPLIADLADAGMEALNPIQVNAGGMGDTAKMKAEFGDRLAFWGAIDTGTVLPTGSPADVREEVRRRIHDLAPGGGYVLCSVHNVQPEVPPENVVAMFDSGYELGQYPLRV
jgi:uroporphyrinogen decarboxylase